MKTPKNHPKGIFLFILLFALKSFGQLSGTVTINAGAAASVSNFTSFTALATVLNSAGVSGPLVVNVAPNSGPYVEQVTFNQITGASATNTITINGNQCVLSYTMNNSGNDPNWVLLLKQTDYMHFNNLSFLATRTNNGAGAGACRMCEGADYNSFSNCLFQLSNTTTLSDFALAITSFTDIYISNINSGTSGSYNVFTNCTIEGGTCGVLINGTTAAPFTTGNSFARCQIINPIYYGLYAMNQENLVVKGCHVDRSSIPGFAVGYGLYFRADRGGLICEKNCVENLAGNTMPTTAANHLHGIYYDATGMPAGRAPSTFSRNFVQNLVTQAEAYGMEMIALNGSCISNTVELNNGSAALTGNVCDFYAQPSAITTDTLKVLYNYFSIKHNGSGPKYGVYLTSNIRVKVDFNAYYLAPNLVGSKSIGFLNSPVTNFSQWKNLGLDQGGMAFTSDPNAANPLSCGSTTTGVVTHVQTKDKIEDFKLFPNPANDIITFQFENAKTRSIEVSDVCGRLYISVIQDSPEINLNTSELPNGIYFVKVRSAESLVTGKFLKQ